jgi:hypothetical protein
MDRPHRGPAGPARASGGPVTMDRPAVTASAGTATIVGAQDLVKSFGETPALRGVSLNVRPGILAALGIIAATFPLLARITGPEVARNE